MTEKNIIISVHGIRTKGKWQEKLGRILEEENFNHKPFKFGYYDVFHFINPFSNNRMIERFYNFYCETIRENYQTPSIVAHSFGTFIVAYCLFKRQHIKFNKIIFCGSILPQDFDWSTLLARNQVNQVRNEYSKLDFWARIVKKFIRKTGSSGFSGHSYKRPNFFEKRFEYKHSDYFSGNHMKEYWIPFLNELNPVFKVLLGNELLLKDYYKFLDECKDIDMACFAGTTNRNLPEGLTKKWISINNDIYTFVLDEKSNKIKGYINAMPLRDLTFRKLIAGEILDEDITEDDIESFSKNKELKIYFMSIATKQDVRQFKGGLINTVGDRLFAGFFKKLIDYWENDNIKIVEFATIAWTSQGRMLCKEIGMQMIGYDKFNYPIYLFKTQCPSNFNKLFIQGIDNLIKSYNAKK